jgi:hypothetical protein
MGMSRAGAVPPESGRTHGDIELLANETKIIPSKNASFSTCGEVILMDVQASVKLKSEKNKENDFASQWQSVLRRKVHEEDIT